MLSRLISQFHLVTAKRLILTQAYPCSATWNDRLKQIDIKLTANDLNIKLQASLNNNIPVSALDFDILMNKVDEIDIMNLNYVNKVVMDFRKTQESIKVFDSSAHSLIRNLIHLDEPYQAFDLICDRQNTGIFLDEVSVNLLVDKFIIENNWEKAFLTCSEWLLQEDYESSKLSIAFSLLSCLHFWHEKLWLYKPPIVGVSDLPEEFVFVPYLKSETFDDHFDLTNNKYRRRLLGKCLCIASQNFESESQNVDDNLEIIRYVKSNGKLLGLALHEKLDGVVNHLEKWLEENKGVKLNESLITHVEELIKTCERKNVKEKVVHQTFEDEEVEKIVERYKFLIQQFRAKQLIDEKDFLQSSLQLIELKINEHCNIETDLVQQKYIQFNENRAAIFEKTKQKMINKSILEQSKQKLLELTEQEELMKYFEEMPEIMYKSWLAKRTKEEKSFSFEKDEQENLNNLKKKEKQRFIVQHVVE